MTNRWGQPSRVPLVGGASAAAHCQKLPGAERASRFGAQLRDAHSACDCLGNCVPLFDRILGHVFPLRTSGETASHFEGQFWDEVSR